MEGDKGQQQRKVFHIGSRKSQLALIQTKQIKKQLKGLYPDLKFKIVPISTKGDQILDVALSKIGDKGLFTKELEDGILNKSLDFAVHSLKDMPTALPEGLTIGVIGKREIPNDALIVNEKNKGHTLETLPPGSVVGTSSLRRKSQIQKHFPHLTFKDVRGNLNTRLRKLDEGEYDCLILAASGMKRLGAGDRIQVLSEKHCFWAVGQGALSVECRADDAELLGLLSKIDDSDTRAVCLAERALLRELEGGCQVPVGVSSSIEEGEGGARQVHLYGIVLNIDGSKSVEGNIIGPLDQADSLGRTLARQLKDKGASEILEEIAAISRS